MPFYTTQILSANQETTPEGFLLCKNVAIARTGTMLYVAGEVPVEPSKDGLIRIDRTPEQVFAPATISSFEGKAVTLDHPSIDVTPSNWSTLAKGFAHNVRRGTGIDQDLLLADLLVTESTAIAAVREGLREVSCGYEADYQQIQPGHGLQTNIIGNHIALVEKGRCGSRCAIGDSEPMKKISFLDKIRRAFKANDEAALEEALQESATKDEAEESEEDKKKKEGEESAKTGDALTRIADSLEALSSRVAALEGTQDAKAKDEDEAETKKDSDADGQTEDSDEEKDKTEDSDEADEDEDQKEKTSDSAALAFEAQDTFARAEILAPGLSLPTFDAAADSAKTRDSLCALKRKALTLAFNAGKHKDAITPFVGTTTDFQSLTCDQLTLAFTGASEIVKRVNNAQQTKVTFDGSQTAAGIRNTISSINRRNSDFWNRQQ